MNKFQLSGMKNCFCTLASFARDDEIKKGTAFHTTKSNSRPIYFLFTTDVALSKIKPGFVR
jgi:hypothetical protein